MLLAFPEVTYGVASYSADKTWLYWIPHAVQWTDGAQDLDEIDVIVVPDKMGLPFLPSSIASQLGSFEGFELVETITEPDTEWKKRVRFANSHLGKLKLQAHFEHPPHHCKIFIRTQEAE